MNKPKFKIKDNLTTEEKQICDLYWQLDIEGNYQLKVEDIATQYNKTRQEVIAIVKRNCNVVFRCDRCTNKIEVKLRTDIEKLKTLNTYSSLSRIVCKECQALTYYTNQTHTHSIFGYNQRLVDYYNVLKKIYPVVFPKISPSVFVKLNNFKRLSREDYSFYLRTSFNFVICTHEYKPLFAIDYLSVKDWNTKNEVKKRLLSEAGLKYFILPYNEDEIINHVPKQNKEVYLDELFKGRIGKSIDHLKIENWLEVDDLNDEFPF